MNCLWSSSRLFLQLFLTFTFFFFFGLPAVKKYLSREVMVVRTVKKNWEGLVEPPAITINARNPITKYGWKDNGLNFWGHLKTCLENNASDHHCFLDQLYNQSDVFNDILLGYTRKESLKNITSLWIADFSRLKMGPMITFHFPFSVGPDLFQHRIIFELSYNVHHRIWIHDPKYFVVTSNGANIPMARISINPNETNNYYLIFQTTEVSSKTVSNIKGSLSKTT